MGKLKLISYMAALAMSLVVGASLHASEPTIESNELDPSLGFTTRVWTASYLGQYRIPSAVQTRGGIILAFAEKRDRQGDQAGNDIVLKRSLDGGRTWGVEQEIHQMGGDALNNPMLLVTSNDLCVLMFNRYPEGHNPFSSSILPGANFVKTFVMYSSDAGNSWTDPIDITDQVTPDEAGLINLGPGNGFIGKNGSVKGRAIMAAFAKWSPNPRDFSDSRAITIYSDEVNDYQVLGGHPISQAEAIELSTSWTHGQTNVRSQSNEITMVEYGETGSLYYLARKYPDRRTGGAFYDSSFDGGINWNGRNRSLNQFPYRTQSGLWRLDNLDGTVNITHTTPVGNYSYSKGRTDGRIIISRQLSGQSLTWRQARSRVITDNLFSNSAAAEIVDPLYPAQRVGVIYEGNTNKQVNKIAFINYSSVDTDYVRQGPIYERPKPY